MDRFDGNLKGLKSLIRTAGYDGSWSVIAHGYEFSSRDGAVLDWFPDFSRKLYYKGPSDAAGRLRQALATERMSPIPPTAPDQRGNASGRQR